jgi:prolyl-tRNA synthetase
MQTLIDRLRTPDAVTPAPPVTIEVTSFAPFEVVVTVVKIDDPQTAAVAETTYAGLLEAGIDVIIDDRPERPGVKFADAELVGVPYRITVGPRGLAEGVVEAVRRSDGEKLAIPVDEAVATVSGLVVAERS